MNRIIYVVNDARFVTSHFLAWALAARTAGFNVAVFGPAGTDPATLNAHDIEVLGGVSIRRGLRPANLWRSATHLKQLSASNQPTIVHCFGLHGMAIAMLTRIRGVRLPLVVSITGLGFLMTVSGPLRHLIKVGIRLLASGLRSRKTIWIAENPHDVAYAGLSAEEQRGRVVQVMGAGVDLSSLKPTPVVREGPLRLILVSRMIWSKGVDLAVAALELARIQGVNATLTLVGAPDHANPKSYTREQLLEFRGVDGVTWLGPRDDVHQLLSDHNVFILPSRGGEGLPKVLLEAAAAQRPAIVSDVPGCSDFVEPGLTGWVVASGSVSALASAIEQASKADIGQMGRRARQKVEAGGDSDQVAATVVGIYKKLENWPNKAY